MADHTNMELPDTAAGRLLWSASLVEPVDMKLKRGKSLLTVELPPDVVIRTGARYVLVDEVDANDALLCDAMAEPGPEAVVLAAYDETGRRVYEGYGSGIEVKVGRGVKFTLYQHRPTSERPERAHWWGIERRLDARGRWWESSLPDMVMDDFGELVEVPA